MLLKFILLFTLEFQILRIFIFLQFKIIQIKVTFGSRVINRSESRPDVALFAKNVFATRSESPTTKCETRPARISGKGFTHNNRIIIGAIIVAHYYLKMGILDTENREMDIRKINANQTKAYSSSTQMQRYYSMSCCTTRWFRHHCW